MHSLIINIENKALLGKILWMLKHFENNGVEISNKEDFEDWKMLKDTRSDATIPLRSCASSAKKL